MCRKSRKVVGGADMKADNVRLAFNAAGGGSRISKLTTVSADCRIFSEFYLMKGEGCALQGFHQHGMAGEARSSQRISGVYDARRRYELVPLLCKNIRQVHFLLHCVWCQSCPYAFCCPFSFLLCSLCSFFFLSLSFPSALYISLSP